MTEKLRNKESELQWKKNKPIHKNEEIDEAAIKELEKEINDLNIRYIPSYIITNSNDFKRFFSDEYIQNFVIDFRKEYTMPGYGLQSILEDFEYDSFGYWEETSKYYKSNSNYNFSKAVEFSRRLEAIYEWKKTFNDISN